MGEFFLSLTSTGKAFRRCEVSWINEDRIGARLVMHEKKRRKIARQRYGDATALHAR